MTITPYVYQSVAIRKAVAVLRKTNKALIDMATGLGKTFTAAFIVKALKSRRVLFLVHNNFILDNAMDEFKLVLGEKVKMAVYNGQSKNGSSEADIVFATWQTMQSNLKKWKRNHFDIVVVDEAHHSEAETWKPVVKYFTGMKLGLTATPDRQDEADIRGTFGPEVVKITLEEAIARGWLPRIEYHVITDESLDEEKLVEICREIREHHRRFSISEIDKRLFIRKRDAEIARIINGYDEKAIIFCASVQHTERFVKYLKLGDTFHSSKVKGNSKKTWDLNQKVLDHLKNGVVRRVCAVNAFNEGVNVPSVGLVAFCRVTGSMTIFRQQLGRGLRPGKDKLIVLDFVGNLERVKAVMELMNRVADFHECITSSKEREREGYSRSKFEITGAGFEFTFSDEIVNLMEVLEATQVEFYPTWQEASKATKKLKIKNQREYCSRYREDSRLPSHPLSYYSDFPGMEIFLGKEVKRGRSIHFYSTWQEASKAAIKLGIENSTVYKDRYQEDPCLISVPDRKYKDFPGWQKFLGNKCKIYYPSWQEASRVAVNLGIKTKLDYDSKYSSNIKLPAAPNTYYADFPGWVVFLGRIPKKLYPTWQEASKVAIKLGAKSSFEYKKVFKKDKKLPTAPWTKYKDFPGWKKFLGKK